MILLLTAYDDTVTERVAELLRQRGAEYLWFDDVDFPSQAHLSLTHPVGEPIRHTLRWGGKTYDLSRVTAAWDRRPSELSADPRITDPTLRAHVEREANHFLTDVWNTLECLWIPAPRSAVKRADHKSTQLEAARQVGMEIPPTLVTNDPREFFRFYREHDGHVVSKSFHWGAIHYGREEEKNIWALNTEPVSRFDLGYAASIRYSPVIFQAYVPKRLELRITVVGDRVFPCEIHSQTTNRTRHDWRRYDLSHTPHHVHDLPESARLQCLEITRRLGLNYGCIDMVLTPDGRYVFLEINPNGQYGWIESLTGMPIGEAICDLLLSREQPLAEMVPTACA